MVVLVVGCFPCWPFSSRYNTHTKQHNKDYNSSHLRGGGGGDVHTLLFFFREALLLALVVLCGVGVVVETKASEDSPLLCRLSLFYFFGILYRSKDKKTHKKFFEKSEEFYKKSIKNL